MNHPRPICRPVAFFAGTAAWLGGLLLATLAIADSWLPPTPETTESANGQFRVTVLPRPIGGALPYFEDKVAGVEKAGQAEGEAQATPIARIERRVGGRRWAPVREHALVNDVAPTEVLLSNDGATLVTFDNWHSMGHGTDVVVVYDARGEVVRQFSLEALLPPAHVAHLPRSVSSIWWRRDEALVDEDRVVEVQVALPGDDQGDAGTTAPVRIRLADGAVLPPEGAAWDAARARATALETKRQAAWDALRARRLQPLEAPASDETEAWRAYLFELRERIAGEDETMAVMPLAAGSVGASNDDGYDITRWITYFEGKHAGDWMGVATGSPTSDRLADLLVAAFATRDAGSMAGVHLVFVGTPEEGARVAVAAERAGVKLTFVDRGQPYPPGTPLPDSPPPMWQAWMAR